VLNIFIGFYPWKSLFWKLFNHTIFITNKKNPKKFMKLFEHNKNTNVHIWGHKISKSYEKAFKNYKIKPSCVEDGFVRSFGLGADFIKPSSIVIDKSGIYYDSTKISDLEDILSNISLTKKLELKTRFLINKIIKNNITKYNIENLKSFNPINVVNKKIIFVVGQVAKDASIKYGTFVYKTDLDFSENLK
jgi:capsular polysaccharide export protein